MGHLDRGWGIVTGLAAEARLAGPNAAAGGGTPEGAARVAEQFVAAGASALISFGLAGGLDPALRPGFLLVPHKVVSPGSAWQCDTGLVTQLGGATVEALFAGASVAATRAEKDSLWRLTGASAIDLESGAVADVAQRHGLPFAVLRALCDPASRDLPPAALLALDPAGGIGLLRVLRSLLGNPAQLRPLLVLADDARRARSALRAKIGGLLQDHCWDIVNR